jgi:SPP1 gp7 family putative phage head morphogenesis protein
VGAPQPPSPARWLRVARPLAVQAAGAERALLQAAGAPSRILDRLVLDTPPPVRRPSGRRISRATGAPDVPAIGLVRGGVLEESLAAWASEGVALIRSVPREELADLPQRAAKIADSGARWETLRDELRVRLGVAESRLNLIARDQVAKLNGRVTEDFQRAAGVDSYIWRATDDDRVRESHLAQDGLTFRWDEPGPPVGFYDEPAHPGQGGQCRCTAEPVSPDWWREAIG